MVLEGNLKWFGVCFFIFEIKSLCCHYLLLSRMLSAEMGDRRASYHNKRLPVHMWGRLTGALRSISTRTPCLLKEMLSKVANLKLI